MVHIGFIYLKKCGIFNFNKYFLYQNSSYRITFHVKNLREENIESVAIFSVICLRDMKCFTSNFAWSVCYLDVNTRHSATKNRRQWCQEILCWLFGKDWKFRVHTTSADRSRNSVSTIWHTSIDWKLIFL